MSNNKDIKPTNSRKSRSKTKPGVIMPAPDTLAAMPEGYSALLVGLKERIGHERIKAVISANAAMVLLYWDIGQSILERQHQAGWGAKVIDRLSHDLKTAFPDMTGFSPRNLKYMRTFAQAWPDRAIVQRTVAQLPGRSNLTLFSCSHAPRGNKDTARCAVYRWRGHLHSHAARGNESNSELSAREDLYKRG